MWENSIKRKNILTLLKVFQQLKEKYFIPHQLVLVGTSGDGSRQIEDWLARGNHPDVVQAGFIPDQEMRHLYTGAEALVYPSLYEGFGLPVLEAMACGCPVITSTVSSIPEVAGTAALLIDPYREDEMAQAILRLIREPFLAQQLREQGRIQAQKFTWDRQRRPHWRCFTKRRRTVHRGRFKKMPSAETITLSVVSHGQGALVERFFQDLQTYCALEDLTVILTLNMAEALPFQPEAFSFPLRIRSNRHPRGGFAGHPHHAALPNAPGTIGRRQPDFADPIPFPPYWPPANHSPPRLGAPLVVNPIMNRQQRPQTAHPLQPDCPLSGPSASALPHRP